MEPMPPRTFRGSPSPEQNPPTKIAGPVFFLRQPWNSASYLVPHPPDVSAREPLTESDSLQAPQTLEVRRIRLSPQRI